jgi:glucosyl-3-phosphoglycerate synthase
MEYVQERIATLHDFGDGGFEGPGADSLAETAVVVPMTGREHESPAAERVLSELERLDPAAVFVPVRASADRIGVVRDWLESFRLSMQVLWCNAPEAETLLAEAGIDGEAGKGLDVWLALGPAAAAAEYVVVHDADVRSYEADHVRRLLAPLTMGFAFSKGYYARVEQGRLYGRLCRLLYEPLIRALSRAHDEPVIGYLGAFRYALAGEFAMTSDLVETLRPPRAWGLEVGALGDAFEAAGFAETAQVDLGRHEHDHRIVPGENGLEGMSREVAAAVLRVVNDHGVDPDYEALSARYLAVGESLIDQYSVDAAFNGFEYDLADERSQLECYAAALSAPGPDRRLPSWRETTLEPDAVLDATARRPERPVPSPNRD